MTNTKQEVMEVSTGPERRRRWPVEEKVSMVRETFEPGKTISMVARLHGMNPNQLFHWRKLYQGGCDLFDIDELRREYSAEEFANLLMCAFSDDSLSAFKLAELQRCMVDSWEEWAGDFSPLLLRPFGYREVWVGYDPALDGDSAGRQGTLLSILTHRASMPAIRGRSVAERRDEPSGSERFAAPENCAYLCTTMRVDGKR
ncbi:transposase [Burkholderia gladioli]